MGILRVLLALFVVFDHSRAIPFLNLPGGPFAVKVFFIISGFYMTLILSKKYIGPGSYGLFITNRFLRLYPIYWVIIGLTVGLSFLSFFVFNNWMRLTPYVVYNEFMNFSTLGFLGLTNLLLFGQDVVMFLGLNIESGSMFFTSNFVNTNPPFHDFLFIPQAWTVGLELIFYIVAPFMVRRKIKVVLFLITVSILIRGYIYFVLDMPHDPWTYRFFPNELALFLVGTLSYHIFIYFQTNPIKPIYHKTILCAYFFVLIFYNYLPDLSYSVDIKSVIFYILTGLSIPSIFLLSKGSKIDNRIGDLSYPIYLVHMLIIYIVSLLVFKLDLNLHKGTFVVIFTLLVSYLLIKYISDPIEKIRQNRVKLKRKS